MADMLVITGTGASLGFRCAGLKTQEMRDGADISGLLLGLQAEGRFGVVAVEERFFQRVPDNVMKRLRKKGLPIIISINIPEKWGQAAGAESPVMRLIRRAIGYQIKLKR